MQRRIKLIAFVILLIIVLFIFSPLFTKLQELLFGRKITQFQIDKWHEAYQLWRDKEWQNIKDTERKTGLEWSGRESGR